MKRINWIDWAKSMAAVTVVFCHLPQSQEWFYFRYLQACIITVFFFLSGYLKKDRGSMKANWQKYWRGLVLPYMVYNILVYPYWLSKYSMLNEGIPPVSDIVRPLVVTCLGEPLDGPLWYLPAILLMHVLTDALCHKRYFHHAMVMLCVASFFLYAANKYYEFAPYLVPMGVFRRLPYFYLGYVLGRNRWLLDEPGGIAGCQSVSWRRNLVACSGCLALSLLLFWWHLYEERFLLHIALFYPVNVGFLFAVLCGCKLLNGYAPPVVVRLSMGTLVIIGLHVILISCANYLVCTVFHVSKVCYHWYEALPLSLLIVVLLYPLIIFAERHFHVLLGR